ncbi:hypothetical protein NP493_869g01006 [Ridgeia piscesae]|uniref:Uncharacterized protein n=1 Tax=Ridgeia piscesae TaxID=27915 RepID=A0AAD9KLJ4_RIDPI|nr:hypothetical protein NP493_869g01006 [Ridgeia piscesae]
MISVGSCSVLGRRLVVGYGLLTLPNVLRVVGGEILLKLVTVFGLAGLDGLFRCISRFLVFVIVCVIVFVRILFRLQLVFDISIEPRFFVGIACYCFRWNTEAQKTKTVSPLHSLTNVSEFSRLA